MSGLIFSLLLVGVTISAIIEALRKNPNFSELEKDRSWRGLIKKDDYSVELFVKRDDKQVQFILPDLSIPKDTCKKVVDELAGTLCEEIKDESGRRSVNVVSPSGNFCQFCLEQVKELLFRCKRCGRYYCSEHRFPEKHNCPGKENADIRIKHLGKNVEREYLEEDKPKEILIKEIPCG